uniref:ARAD1C39798p n=1 Tax=Blastobotrys adeninivorans TaxID=409370 RepID=A0A060T8W3_BLAAD
MALAGRYLGVTAVGAVIGYFASPWTVLKYATEHELPKKGTLAAAEYNAELEADIQDLSIVKKLKADKRYKMVRSWQNMNADELERMFTAGTLSTPGALSIPPLVFVDEEDKSTVAVVHCGRLLTGFPLIIHGGVLGTLLEEALRRIAILNFKDDRGVVSRLTLNYKAPTLAHQFLLVKTHTESADNKKVSLRGTVETLQGKTLVKAQGQFASPSRWF